jgi:hypothetical protein
VRRTLPTSVTVAMESVRQEALSSHRPQTVKLRPEGERISPLAWADEGFPFSWPSREGTFVTKRHSSLGKGKGDYTFPHLLAGTSSRRH